MTLIAKAQVGLPAVFSDNMVLQQRSDVPVWGWGNPNQEIKVVGSWAISDTISTRINDKGEWCLMLKTSEAGGPYSVSVLGENKIVFDDVMLGEVWLCSGQSNMAWTPESGLVNQKEEIATATDKNIRFFKFPPRACDYPQRDYPDMEWEVCSPETMAYNSAVAYFFAKKIREAKNVPVGLIVSAWGGTPAETWIPKDSVENNPILCNNKMNERHPYRPVDPGVTYNQMIYPVIPYRIAGTIWYQGESNCGYADTYGLLMKTLIESWRSDFGKDMPFYFVQIAPFCYNNANNGPAILREQQEFVSKLVPNTGMIVVSDLVDDIYNIHPINKQDVGKRLADMALVKTYGDNISGYMSPTYRGMEIKGDKVMISFYDSEGGIVCRDKKVEGLFVAGQDGVWQPATGKIKDGVLIVSSDKVSNPINVRYCFDEATCGNLFAKGGLPVAPFRTDRRVSF
ncbi:MAG: sialate O-acetylesterase [Bacteroidales bacterium]